MHTKVPVNALLVLLSSMLLVGMLLFGKSFGFPIARLACTGILVAIALMAALSIFRAFLPRG